MRTMLEALLTKQANVGITAPAAQRAWELTKRLNRFDPMVASPLLRSALPAALLGGGAMYATDRLFSRKPQTWEEEQRQKRRRLMLSLGVGALAGYGAANTTWRHTLAPEAGTSLASAVVNPLQSTAAGLAEHSQENQARVADLVRRRGWLPQRLMQNVTDITAMPVIGNISYFLPSLFDPYLDARRRDPASLPQISETAYQDYLQQLG